MTLDDLGVDVDLVIDDEFSMAPDPSGLERYDESAGANQNWVRITEIVVPDQYAKDQLLKAFEYIHNIRELDTGFLAVNELAHIYTCPDIIKVQE